MTRSGKSLKTGDLRRKYNMKKKKTVKSRKKSPIRKKRRRSTARKHMSRGRTIRTTHVGPK